MLLAVLSVCTQEELEDDLPSDDGAADRAIIDQATTAEMRASRRQQIKNKILAVGKMQLMFQNLRYATATHQCTYTHVGYIQ
jgi:serine/threonine-protein phosphatase 2B catalytic subunit